MFEDKFMSRNEINLRINMKGLNKTLTLQAFDR